MKKRLLISFSGGRTSAFMTWWLLNEWQERDTYEMVVVFSNTGKEREETLDFVRQCDLILGFNAIWIESAPNPKNNYGVKARIVDFETANRNGKPFEEVIKKHGLPNMSSGHCSRQMKGEAIRAFARTIGWKGKNYKTAIGIRSDELHRVNWKTAKKNNLIYPFVTLNKVTKNDVNIFWSKQVFDLQLKSYEGNCDFCWKKSLRKLMTIAQENPLVVEWWREMESKYENFVPEQRLKSSTIDLPIRMYRENMTVDDIVEESKFPFRPAQDESKRIVPSQGELFNWTEYLDSNGGCVESCEAF